MLSYYLKSKKNWKGIAMFLSKCAVCDSKKSRFITQQELADC